MSGRCLGSGQQPHRRRQRQPPGLAGEALGIEGDEALAGTAAAMVRRIGEIQPARQVAERGFDGWLPQ
jgi:hypothetical protein